jgi:hypothetical protein
MFHLHGWIPLTALSSNPYASCCSWELRNSRDPVVRVRSMLLCRSSVPQGSDDYQRPANMEQIYADKSNEGCNWSKLLGESKIGT